MNNVAYVRKSQRSADTRQNCIDFVLELKKYLQEQQRKAVFLAKTDKENIEILRKTLGETNTKIAKFLGSW